jgi:nitrogen fixation NifU-like protein
MSNQLYREQFMEVFKSSANYGKMDTPTITGDQQNSICGDTMSLQLKIENNIVTDAKFTGVSCAVSKTSASIITEEIKNKKVSDLRKLTDKDILKLIQFDLTFGREQCALLCYYALEKALEGYDKQETGKNKNHKGQ